MRNAVHQISSTVDEVERFAISLTTKHCVREGPVSAECARVDRARCKDKLRGGRSSVSIVKGSEVILERKVEIVKPQRVRADAFAKKKGFVFSRGTEKECICLREQGEGERGRESDGSGQIKMV